MNVENTITPPSINKSSDKIYGIISIICGAISYFSFSLFIFVFWWILIIPIVGIVLGIVSVKKGYKLLGWIGIVLVLFVLAQFLFATFVGLGMRGIVS